MERFYNSKINRMFIGFVIAFIIAAALGQTEDNNTTDSRIISAAGPRLGTVIVVEVTIPNRNALGELARSEYDISNVRGNVVTIYATEAELKRLRQTGYPLREIGRDPQPQNAEVMALGSYHSYDALMDELNAYAESFPGICRLETVGPGPRALGLAYHGSSRRGRR